MSVHAWSDAAVDAELVHSEAGATLVGHSHSSPHALIVLDGVITDDGRPYRDGDVRLSPGHDRHFVRFQHASTCLILTSRNGSSLPTVFERWSGAFTKADADWMSPLRRAAVARTPTPGELADLVGHTLTSLKRMPGWQVESAPWLRELRRRITEGEEPRAEAGAVARIAGVSREHLSRSFQRRYGTSFVTFRHHQRVARACELMRSTAWPLAEIACAAGFADQSHMTRAFAHCLGRTPSAFRSQWSSRVQVTNVQA